MSLKSRTLYGARLALSLIALMQFSFFGPVLEGAKANEGAKPSRSPIKHVIIIVGENRTFDHIFATYKPRRGETVDNLLSKAPRSAQRRPDGCLQKQRDLQPRRRHFLRAVWSLRFANQLL